MTDKKELTSTEWVQLILGAALVFGVLVRFLPGIQTGFPINDGGMFLNMIQDLRESRYALPEFTSYNLSEIPYAYPPFGFYVGRILSDFFQIPALDLLRWLPPLINSLSIFVFYVLVSELLKSRPVAALASAFYALTPGAFGAFVMGGGLTRSFGSLFLLLSAVAVLRLFHQGEGKYAAFSILFGSLAVLSHPEAGMHTAATCILLWLFFGRGLSTFRNAVIVGAGVLLVTSPWWLTVFSNHGLEPILSALKTGSYGVSAWVAWYKVIFEDGLFIPLLAVLRLVGIGWGIWRKNYFLVIWVFLPHLVEPRSAPSVAFYPLTMLTALAFAEAIPFLVGTLGRASVNFEDLFKNRPYNIAVFLLLTYLLVESSLYGFRLVGTSLKPADLQTMAWIKENTPADALFLPLTGVPSPEIDPYVEWFPNLTERRSQATFQGYEWLLGDGFFVRYYDLVELQQCKTFTCVEEWSHRTNLDYQIVVVDKSEVSIALISSFRSVERYREIYTTDEAVVFERVEK